MTTVRLYWQRLGGAVEGRARLTLPMVGLVALVVAIAVSPRFPLPMRIGRRFDLRLEDLLLVALAFLWWRRGGLRALRHNQIAIAFTVYLSVSLLSTLVNTLAFGLNPTRAIAFWGKNLEYFLIFAMVATWARAGSDRARMVAALLLMGLINLAWVVVQLLSRSNHALLATRPVGGWPHDSYGPGLIGEISPLSTGTFFLIQFSLWFALFAFRRQLLRYAGAVLALLAMVLAESRVSYLGSGVCALVVARSGRRFWALMAAFAAAFAFANGVLISTGDPDVARVTGIYFIEQSFAYRVQVIWRPLADKYAGVGRHQPVAAGPSGAGASPAVASPTPARFGLDEAPPPSAALRRPPAILQVVIGFGNGAMGYAAGLPTEAHNHFLRVFLESGVVGLAAFVALIAALARHLWAVTRRRAEAEIDAVLAVATSGLLAAFLLGSLLQDMFFPVIPNELLWLLVGLTVAPVLGPVPAAEAPRDYATGSSNARGASGAAPTP